MFHQLCSVLKCTFCVRHVSRIEFYHFRAYSGENIIILTLPLERGPACSSEIKASAVGSVSEGVFVGGEQDGFGMAAWTTTWGLKEPVFVYVWVTMSSLEITVPLSSPKSQLKLMSELAR